MHKQYPIESITRVGAQAKTQRHKKPKESANKMHNIQKINEKRSEVSLKLLITLTIVMISAVVANHEVVDAPAPPVEYDYITAEVNEDDKPEVITLSSVSEGTE